MLFNSYEFIFLFLPCSALGYFLCARYLSLESALGFLVLASLFFYGYWNPAYLVLIFFSIGFNFVVGRVLSNGEGQHKRALLIFGVVVNLGLLGYYKYANFFVDNINVFFGSNWSFFPQLIAGPIVHHREIIPQFMRAENLTPKWSNIAIGLSIFSIGLFKKTVIADSLSEYVTPVYDADLASMNLDFFLAWGSTLAYTFQLYFDFSGYSDMAIGCARIFGIVLPVNFFSPYKSTSIIEFWRRWHITLSRFLRDYLYIALGGNQKGNVRRYVNLFLTMLLGGLWHGAGWTFVVWGGLHGSYLMVNHAWAKLLRVTGRDPSGLYSYRLFCWFLTFVAVVFSWAYFRAPTLGHGNQVALAMLGMSGFQLPAGLLARLGEAGEWLATIGVTPAFGGGAMLVSNYALVLCAALIALCLPNVAQLFSNYNAVLYESDSSFQKVRASRGIAWSYNARWATVVSVAFVLGLMTLSQVSEFLYFQF